MWLKASFWCWLLFHVTGRAASPAGTTSQQPGDTWRCPEIAQQPLIECTCDMPHTLRCTGSCPSAIQMIGDKLRSLGANATVSLLDCTLLNITSLPTAVLSGVALHGLVISSGEITQVDPGAFDGLAAPLQALGLPNNKLSLVPTLALRTLPELDRLDLSSNKMKLVDDNSFKGVTNLSFIELSENAITRIGPNAFADLPQLKVLRLRGNRLTLSAISGLKALPSLEELDLSWNALVGPLGVSSLPPMRALSDLQLGHNSLSSIKMGALRALANLSTLSLNHNQIDVLEDNAFSHLTALTQLDLGHNRIVAVSGASLAHLVNLRDLDLRHNFLRALTADLVQPLRALADLRLDDNEISIVATDALRNSTVLQRLTLADNPLNCDCSLAEFATWLDAADLPAEDKSSAVCATPPSLENGLLVNVIIKELVCGEEDDLATGAETTPVDRVRIELESISCEGPIVTLRWAVDRAAVPYVCDAIFVYEEEEQAEVLLGSSQLACNSSNVDDPLHLSLAVPASMHLQMNHRYRYCVVLLGAKARADDLNLVLGCSDVLPLLQNARLLPRTSGAQGSPKTARIIAIQANLSQDGSLAIRVNVLPASAPLPCEINVAVLAQGVLVAQRRINCSEPKYTYAGPYSEGPYRVCANVIAAPEGTKPRCITIFRHAAARRFSALDVAFVSIFLILSFMLIALIWGVRRVLLRPKLSAHQCFMPPELGNEQQHNRYVKLQATTKL